MSRYLRAGAIALFLLGLSTSSADAQDQWLAGLYGSGVHAFFAGDYDQAHKLLTSAIDEGTRDPRCYYFRGLAYLRLGRPDEAAADFKKGAELETGNTERFYAVSEALERVQGYERLQVEQYREAERLAARARELALRRARYERLQRAEEHVLRHPDHPPSTDVPPLPKNASLDPTDPFRRGEGAPMAAGQPEVIAPSTAIEAAPPEAAPAEGNPPVEENPPAEENPFAGSPAAGAATPDASDPFGAGAAAAPSGEAQKSTLGALFRAMGKSLPGAPAGESGPPADAGANPFGGAAAPGAAAPAPGAPTPPPTQAPDDPFAPSAPGPAAPGPEAPAPAPAPAGAAPAEAPSGGAAAPGGAAPTGPPALNPADDPFK